MSSKSRLGLPLEIDGLGNSARLRWGALNGAVRPVSRVNPPFRT